jgi:hypothetical protein
MMPKPFVDVATRSFDPMALSGVSAKAREAVNAAFDAMSTWRNEVAENSEKNSKKVIEKMAAAAAALGWPEQIVDATRAQMQSIAEMQIKTMDQIMAAWEEQLKSPDPMAITPSAMLSKLQSVANPATGWPSASAFQTGTVNPMGLWLQFAEQWQKSWADGMSYWTNAINKR